MTDRTEHIILMADDDPDDRHLAEKALRGTSLEGALRFVEDGVELMNYLRREKPYASRNDYPLPDLILLDLNMPRKDGREALEEIKVDASLRRIPVVVLTTSSAEEDVFQTYDSGVNAFITKPVTFSELCRVLQRTSEFWFDIASRPNPA